MLGSVYYFTGEYGMFESVDNYCYSTISNIISTYSEINDKLYNESVTVVNTVPVFQLF